MLLKSNYLQRPFVCVGIVYTLEAIIRCVSSLTDRQQMEISMSNERDLDKHKAVAVM